MAPQKNPKKTDVKKAAPKKRGAKAYKMPEPLPCGEVMTDLCKKKWTLGPSIGVGGFGEIYLASDGSGPAVADKASHVIKIEPSENGPLFVELHFYQRAAKESKVETWRESHKLAHLGVPKYVGSGLHTHKNTRYRFMVMNRFGEDIGKKFLKCGQKFSAKTAYTVAIQIVDALEFLHENEYVHADIKGANILLGHGEKAKDQVFLVDYGLAQRFNPEGRHKEYKEDPRKAHDGTAEYTSRDAHKGVLPSRRGDMEILGYVIVQWLCGKLPWEGKLSDLKYVHQQKEKFMANPKLFLTTCFPGGDYADELRVYLEIVRDMDYTETPDYNKIKNIFKKAIQKSGAKHDGKIDFDSQTTKKRKGAPSPVKQRLASPAPKRKDVHGAGEPKPRGRPAKKNIDESLSSPSREIKSPMRARKAVKSPARATPQKRKRNDAAESVSPLRGRGSAKTSGHRNAPRAAKTAETNHVATQTTPGLKKRATRKK